MTEEWNGYSFKDGDPNSRCNCGHYLDKHVKDAKYKRCLVPDCECRFYRWQGPYYAAKENKL